MTRTIVLSDAHGYPELIRNALTHSRFDAGVDRLVFAGDFVDRGDRPQECLDLIEGAGGEVLWGNHDLAVLFDRFIYPCSGESRGFRPLFLERFRSGVWTLAACVDGVLITHAGVSTDYAAEWEACGREPAKLASRLNEEFRAVAGYLVESGRKDVRPPLLGNGGPTWFRPPLEGVRRILPGLTQIAGHTPCTLPGVLRDLRAAGMHLIDPDVLGGLPAQDRGKYRYAVIEDGAVRVENGMLGIGADC